MRNKATQLLAGRPLIFGSNQGQSSREDWDAFKRLVELAHACGATHVHVGLLPFRHDNWVLPDNTDPYAAWCNHSPGLLRVCPPAEIHPWVSPEHAEQVQGFIGRQLEIMRPYGLKGVSFAVEPMWLPEGVYRAHPRWRGPQCELGRIAARPYFAPSIDEPEVLDLYRRAMRQYATLFPEVEQYRFLSNDSGAGIAWTPNIYPGMNGPTRHRQCDGGARIARWLGVLQDGAAEAGVSMRLNIHSAGFPPALTAAAQQQCVPGTFVRGGNAHGETWSGGGANLPGGIWATFYPVVGLGDPEAFIAGLQGIYAGAGGAPAEIGIYESDLDLAQTLFTCFFDNPGPGAVRRTEILHAAAAAFCGSADGAEPLVAAWRQTAKALHAIGQIRQRGFGLVLPFCGVSMRWLTRPLVPEPGKLTDDERAHYRRFLFTAGVDAAETSFSYVLGKGVFRGESVMWMAKWCLQEAMDTLHGVHASLERLATTLGDAAGRERVRLLAARNGAGACLAANARNTIMYQYALDIADQPQFGPNPMDYDDNILYDQRAVTFRKIAREELDNITELIELIGSRPELVVEHARGPEEESVFMLGPDLRGDLERKCRIMLDHWHDYERLYPSTKVWDYEPVPRGNIIDSSPRT